MRHRKRATRPVTAACESSVPMQNIPLATHEDGTTLADTTWGIPLSRRSIAPSPSPDTSPERRYPQTPGQTGRSPRTRETASRCLRRPRRCPPPRLPPTPPRPRPPQSRSPRLLPWLPLGRPSRPIWPADDDAGMMVLVGCGIYGWICWWISWRFFWGDGGSRLEVQFLFV